MHWKLSPQVNIKVCTDSTGENVNEIISQKSYVTSDHPIAAR